jgi:RNA polymerase sigma-70 factor (ECF subfamily)
MARVAGATGELDAAGLDAAGEVAFRLLVERWQLRVLAFLHRCLGDRDEAQDLAQETFLRVYRAAREGRYDPRARFGPWLFRIAGNLCRGRMRRRRLLRWLPLSRSSGALDIPGPARDRPDAAVEDASTAAAVRTALDRLPERQRIAVVLKRFEGMSYAEIAEVLQTTPAAVESLLVRAHMVLRQELRRAGLVD